MNATILALSLLARPAAQTVYLQRVYPPGARDKYAVTYQIGNAQPVVGELVATTSTNVPGTRQLVFYVGKTGNKKATAKVSLIGAFDRNGMLQGLDLATTHPAFTAFSLASYVPIGSVALDRSAGVSYKNAWGKFVAMTHVRSNGDGTVFAKMDTIISIEPVGQATWDGTVNNIVDLADGRMTSSHLELRHGTDGPLIVADFQLI